VLTAGAGTDTIIGTTGNDTIIGGSGPSVIAAGSGPSVVYAGSGASVLIGGSATDTFIFAPGHTGGPAAASADVIQNFSSALGDTINLSAFDAGLPASAGGHIPMAMGLPILRSR
jgi:Ca2+-binding RTX toxin-like protein